jgi:hypothetical protein
MPERAAIAAVIVELLQFPDSPFLEQPVRGDMPGGPAERPVDREKASGVTGRGDHAIRITHRGRERLLDEHVHATTRHELDVLRMLRRSGTQHREIRLRLLQTAIGIRENAILGDVEIFDHCLHARRIGIADSRDLHAGMLMALAQEIAHVHVIKIQAHHFEFFHERE